VTVAVMSGHGAYAEITREPVKILSTMKKQATAKTRSSAQAVLVYNPHLKMPRRTISYWSYSSERDTKARVKGAKPSVSEVQH